MISSFRHVFGRTLFGSKTRPISIIQTYKQSALTEAVASEFQMQTLSQFETSSFKNFLPELIGVLTNNEQYQGMPIVTEHLAKVIALSIKNNFIDS